MSECSGAHLTYPIVADSPAAVPMWIATGELYVMLPTGSCEDLSNGPLHRQE